jgi:hypothetical protein
MMGHANKDMTSLYIRADLKSIQDKLDRYTLYGMTFDEALATYGAIVRKRGISGRPKPVMLEKAFQDSAIKFNNEEEMRKWIEGQKKKYSQSGAVVVPFPPEI